MESGDKLFLYFYIQVEKVKRIGTGAFVPIISFRFIACIQGFRFIKDLKFYAFNPLYFFTICSIRNSSFVIFSCNFTLPGQENV